MYVRGSAQASTCIALIPLAVQVDESFSDGLSNDLGVTLASRQPELRAAGGAGGRLLASSSQWRAAHGCHAAAIRYYTSCSSSGSEGPGGD